jgi:PAS domain S-box-containing protein
MQTSPGDSNAAARLAGLVDSAMDAIISVDEQQRIVLYNRAAEKIFGWKAAEMLGQPLERLIPERFHQDHAGHVRRFGQTGVTSRRMSGSTVVHALRSNGQEFPIDASISQVDTPEGKLFTVILRDATERIEAAKAQARLAARLTGLLDSAMDGIITIDANQRVIMYNAAAEKIFGWPAAQVVGEPIDMLIPQRFRKAHHGQVDEFGRTGVTSRRMGGSSVIRGLRATGEEFPIDASISQLDTPDGKLYSVILRDVTERVRAQEDLATFAAEAADVREQEKSRIARELHDELAQALTAIKMDAGWVLDNLQKQPEDARRKLRDTVAMIDSAIASTRRISADLRPLILDDLGLVAALEWLVQSFQQRTQVECILLADEDLDLPEPAASAVFRIVQESLANVGKHARATRVEVVFRRRDGHLLLTIEDNGIGFRPDDPRKPQSLGLAGLRERAKLLKGHLHVSSEPGRGTRVEAVMPPVEAG